MSKVAYLLRSAAQFGKPRAWRCPNCGSPNHSHVDNKYLVTRLLRCSDCKLQFRAPIDDEKFNRIFYNFYYQEGATTTMPCDDELATLKSVMFAEHDRDFSGYIAFLKRQGIFPGARILDYGCSWGYGSYQFAKAGYDVYSYEIAEDRRSYAIEKLNIRHVDEPFEITEGHPLAGSFDCFFSAHVLEHVPSPSGVIDLAWQCLKDGGAFIAFTPNGSDQYRRFNPLGWSRMWGHVHPNFLDEVFYDTQFSRSRRLYESRQGSPLHEQYELGCIAYKDASLPGF